MIELLEWDCQFFGFNVAAVRPPCHSPDDWQAVQPFCQENRVRLVQFACDCAEEQSIRFAEQNGFHCVDVRLAFARPLEPISADGAIRRATPADCPTILSGIEGLFNMTRYQVDPHFPRDKAEELYKVWIEKSIAGAFDDVVFMTPQGEGFMTVKVREEVGHIGLVGVKAYAAGHKWGSRLLATALHHFAATHCRHAQVVTQGRNRVAQNYYQQAGFKLQQTELCYHKWYKQI
ncbi:MAG: GNAT family N-acetyltransferase [Magnetococcales bacterium]|nr:GNAT family N-acetyltransferase [Magnetococcales bacterium]MBF0321837.1 GNAT family N-acetyltransferase [Magnetococcales bacterium]